MEPLNNGDEGPEGLQPERTTLAWARTGLATTTAAIVTARVAISRDSVLVAALSGVIAALALLGLIRSSASHAGRHQSFHQQAPSSGLPLVASMTVAATIALCAAGILLVIAS